jgi:hypothetical protein
MKLKEYAETINKLAERYPDLEVVYSSDDEGNSFQKLILCGSLGHFEGDYHGEFTDEDYFEEDGEFNEREYKVNAICIN